MKDVDLSGMSKRLKAIRQMMGIKSQSEVARLIGAEFHQYNNWERGVAVMPVPFAIEICEVSGVDLDYIYLGKVSSLTFDHMKYLKL